MHNFIGSKFKANCRQLFAAISVNLVTFSFGVYTGWSSTVAPMLKDPKQTPLDHVITDNSISWACSWGMLSAILGTFFWGMLADNFGRKTTGFLTMLPYLISWIILLVVKTETALMVSRFLGGLGASGAAINCPMYVGEVSDEAMKAGLGSLFILMYNIGVLYVYVFGVLVNYTYLNVACLAISLLFMVVWFYVPESPIFLIQKKRMDEARRSLMWFRGKDNDKEVSEEMDSMMRHSDQTDKAKLSDYKKRGTVKALLIGLVFQAGTQFSGINIILMYTVEIFKSSGSKMSPHSCTILVGVVQVIGSAVATFIVHRAGRKFFLMVTYGVTALALITIGTCFYINKVDPSINTGILPVFSLSVHVIAFSLGLGMVPYIIYTEVFPANVRNICMSMLMFFNNVLGFAIIKAYPSMSNTLHTSGYFWMFGAVCLAVVPYTYLFVPETKDKSYDEIRRELLVWFPDRKHKDKAAAMDKEATGDQADVGVDNSVVVVEATEMRVCMGRDQNCFTTPQRARDNVE
ncbi:facilitated trehalose transporter Tret1-2 homolog [Melanaphis sacchari]|uniref:Facilitated trehalose transporter Tret1 n=1 Tax=Melanaphis sacchari TaxID=742174 RepID=A0A2H8TZK4_9HEMI|nr:facilitated trehalose transporter Tret1-2 homolog [Melanaphis sacchari]